MRNGEKSQYATVKKPIWVKIYFIWERKLKSHEKGCKNHDNSQMVMPEKNKNILKCNQYKKFLKIPFGIYSDSEHCLKKLKYVITIQKNLPQQK